jgi:hypothetical protein
MPISTEAEQLRTNEFYTKQALACQIKTILSLFDAKHPERTIRTGKV